MAQTKPKAGQFHGITGNGTTGQILSSTGDGGMEWVDNISDIIVSFNTPTGQDLTYTQPNPSSSTGGPGDAFPSTTFTITKSGATLSGTASIAGLPSGITATQSYDNSNVNNTLTITLGGVFPNVNSLSNNLVISGLTVTVDVSFNTPTGQSLTYTQPSPQSSSGDVGSSFTTTTFTVTDPDGGTLSGTASISGLPTGITYTQSYDNSNPGNTLTVTLGGVFPADSYANIDLVLSGLTITAPPFSTDFLVVAGGAAGGSGASLSGGGGAGGLRTSYGSTSGGGASAESSFNTTPSINYTVTVGAGASGTTAYQQGANGSNSTFATITSIGGGGGGGSYNSSSANGKLGGSGGGAGGASQYNGVGGAGTSGQGYAGGNGGSGSPFPCGTGGGAGGAGSTVTSNDITTGFGPGLSVSITGGSTTYAKGGLARQTTALNGTNNTGFGGSGGAASGSGGSGVVILRYPNTFTVTIGAGLTGTTAINGSDKVTTFTAGTGTISFS